MVWFWCLLIRCILSIPVSRLFGFSGPFLSLEIVLTIVHILSCCSVVSFTPRPLPHGQRVLGPIILTTVAFTLSNAGSRWCDYLYRLYVAFDDTYPFLVQQPGQNIGIWGYESQGNCVLYPDNIVLDPKINASRVFSVWTSVVGGAIMILTWFTVCQGLAKIVWASMAFFLFVNSLFEGLTLILKSSALCDPTYGVCSLARGSRCSISALVFWFLAGVSVAMIPPPKGPEPIVMQHTTTTVERVEPDGTKVTETKTETVHVPFP